MKTGQSPRGGEGVVGWNIFKDLHAHCIVKHQTPQTITLEIQYANNIFQMVINLINGMRITLSF